MQAHIIQLVEEISTTEVRRNLASYVRRVELGGETFALTQHGTARAMLVPVDDYWMRRFEQLDDLERAERARREQGRVPLRDLLVGEGR